MIFDAPYRDRRFYRGNAGNLDQTTGKKQFELTQIRLASSDSEAKGIESAVHAPIKEEFFHRIGGKCEFAALQRGICETAKADLQNRDFWSALLRDSYSGKRKFDYYAMKWRSERGS